MSDLEEVEIRSEEVQEILGQPPRWITRWGITVLFAGLLFFFVLSCFLKYPDIIGGVVTVVTDTPPASVVARSNGKIEKLFVVNNQDVKAGDVLGLIENPARYDDVVKVKSMVENFSLDAAPALIYNARHSLGELQRPFSDFVKRLADYKNFLALDHHNKKIESLNLQVEKLNAYQARLAGQKNVLEQDMALAEKQLRRDSLLFADKVMARADYEKAESAYLQKKYALEGARSALANCDIQVAQLQQLISDTRMQYDDEKNKLELSLQEAAETAAGAIASWEQAYVLKAPIGGSITFTRFWSDNQNIKAGDVAFTIVPSAGEKLLGKVTLPLAGSGKVRPGQEVNIKFFNYPYMEYGIVKGTVKSVSLVPADNNYYLEVELSNGLTSTYGKTLPFNQEMQGSADIITEDTRLIERMLRPIRHILNN